MKSMMETSEKKTVKVCHMTSAHKTNDGRIFLKECTSLAKAGYDVYLVGRGESREENGVHVIGVGEPTGGRLSRMTTFKKKVYKAALAIDADIYHFHDPELLSCGKKLKKKGKKVIFDSHELYSEQILNKTYLHCLRYPVAKWYKGYEKRIVKKIDAVVVVTPQMQTHFAKAERFVPVISNFPIWKKRGVVTPSEEKSLCFAGGIDKQWNHHVIVEALQNLSSVKYNLCGVSDETYLESLKGQAGWGKVNYYGQVPFKEAQKIIQQSHIGVALLSPSGNTDGQNGTMGNTKLFEIMMAGKPVICTNFVLWKNIIDKYDCGICIDPQSEEQLTEAISYLLAHPEEAKRMGENGRKAVKEEFNWGVEEKKLLQLYEDLLAAA